jgi:hypothetical protein
MPAKPGIQYSESLRKEPDGAAYWIIRFHR